MKIEIWSDFVCPFCYIGKRNFEEALKLYKHDEPIEIIYRSFELDATAKTDGNLPAKEMLMKKYGLSGDRAAQTLNDLAVTAKAAGLEYHMDRTIQTNTLDAHRLSHYAKGQGKSAELMERLFKAHFTDGLHIGDKNVLLNIAEEAGLVREDALKVLEGSDFSNEVRQDEQDARKLGIGGVPYFLIDGKHPIYGAQPSSAFISVFEKAVEHIG